MNRFRHIESRHIGHFLSLLDEHRKAFFEPPPEYRRYRLYFVDSDVLSTYINGAARNSASTWTSLFSLDSEEQVNQGNSKPAPEAAALAEVIAQAVSRFLFGQFHKQLVAQNRRYYLTAEHAREYQAIVTSVLNQARMPNEEWRNQLQSEYLKLCEDDLGIDDTRQSAEKITSVLVDQSPLGQVPRAYAINREFTSLLSNNLIRLPTEEGDSFIFSEENPDYDAHARHLKTEFFNVFLEELGVRHGGAKKYFPLKRKVFLMHENKLPLKRYVDAVCSDGAMQALGTVHELEKQALIAAREANDVASLARLAALANYLNVNHPLHDGRAWEICLISGSSMLRDLQIALEQSKWKDLVSQRVRIVHPLCFLRHPDLYDPRGIKALERQVGSDFVDEEYALTRIFGNDQSNQNIKSQGSESPGEFVQSLTRTLHGVVARQARDQDPSLRAFWEEIELHSSFSSNVLRETVRRYIANRFVHTFHVLTELTPEDAHTLCHVSIPVLDLQHCPATLRLLNDIRNSVEDRNNENKTDLLARLGFGNFFRSLNLKSGAGKSHALRGFDEVLRDDPSGYSSMLCAALGYVVQGRGWLNAAQTMASTAVVFALGRNSGDYPQGNEALYLRAFLSRLTFDPRKRLELVANQTVEGVVLQWLNSQCSTLASARDELEMWREKEPEAARALIPGADCTRYDLIQLRYLVEELANRLFAIEWQILLNSDTAGASVSLPGMGASLMRLVEEAVDCIRQHHQKLANSNEIRHENPHLASHYRHTVQFVSSQLWAIVLQGWLLLRFRLAEEQETRGAEWEKQFNAIEEFMATELLSFRASMPAVTGKVIHLTMETFAIAKLGKKPGEWGLDKTSFDEVRIAAIDDVRFGFFKDCWMRVGH